MEYLILHVANFINSFKNCLTETILLPLYPQFSTTTSGSSLEDFATKITKSLKREEKKSERERKERGREGESCITNKTQNFQIHLFFPIDTAKVNCNKK